MVWGMGGEESPSLPFPNDFQTIAYWPRADPALPLLRRRNENARPGLRSHDHDGPRRSDQERERGYGFQRGRNSPSR